MRNDTRAVQQWASNVIKSPYWEDVKSEVRRQLLDDIIEAAHVGDVTAIKTCSFMISSLDLTIQALGALSVDKQRARELFETVIEDAE